MFKSQLEIGPDGTLTSFVYDDMDVSGVCVRPDGSMVVVPDTPEVCCIPWDNGEIECIRVPGEGTPPLYLPSGWRYSTYLDLEGSKGFRDRNGFSQSAKRAQKHVLEQLGLNAVAIDVGTVGPGEIPLVSLAIPDKKSDTAAQKERLRKYIEEQRIIDQEQEELEDIYD